MREKIIRKSQGPAFDRANTWPYTLKLRNYAS